MNKFLGFLTFYLVSAFLGAFVVMFLKEVPTANRETVVYMVGQLSGFTGATIAFWFSSTIGSARKTELLARAEPVKE